MKNRMLTAVAAVSLIALLGACSSSSPDADKANTGDTKQASESDNDVKTSPGETEGCSDLMDLNMMVGLLRGDSPGWSSIVNNSTSSKELDDVFGPVKAVLDDLPPEFQQAYPVVEKAAQDSTAPDLNDDEVLAVWAEPDTEKAVVTMIDSIRSVCGLPDSWMRDKESTSSS